MASDSPTAFPVCWYGSDHRLASLDGPFSFVTALDSLWRLVVGRCIELREPGLRRAALIESLPNLRVILGRSAEPLGEFLSVYLGVGANADTIGTFPDHPATDLALDLHGRASIWCGHNHRVSKYPRAHLTAVHVSTRGEVHRERRTTQFTMTVFFTG